MTKKEELIQIYERAKMVAELKYNCFPSFICIDGEGRIQLLYVEEDTETGYSSEYLHFDEIQDEGIEALKSYHKYYEEEMSKLLPKKD